MRRVTFESQTQTQLLAILKEQVTAPDTAVKRIPQAEREARMTLVKNRLAGVSMSGSMEVSCT